MRIRLFVLGLAVLGLGACDSTPSSQPPANSPYYRPPTPAEASCDRQGFVRGSNEYNECLDRESGAPKPLPPPAVTPPAGVEVFRDEFGFRYDGQGNRLDAKGNIISPPVTKP